MGKSKVKVDIKNNRLTIILPACVTLKELESIYVEVRFGIADLQPGFDVVTDLTNCAIGHLNAIPVLWKISSYLTAHKVGRIVRVVSDMGIILKQLLAIETKFKCYKPIYVSTMEEAEQELSSPNKPGGIRFQLHDRPLNYEVHGEQSRGDIVEISTSGCSIRGQTESLKVEMELAVTFELGKQDKPLTSFALQSKVVRVDEDMFVIQFTDVDEVQKRQLYDCLTNELNNNF